MKYTKWLQSIIVVTLVLLSSKLRAQSFYLDMEPPDASVSSGGNYIESGKTYPYIQPNAYGFGEMAAEGRNSESPNSLKSVLPVDSRTGAVNRREWKFYRWKTNTEYWTGFSVKFPNDFPTPLDGEQSTMFAQLQNVWPGKQVAWYIKNSASASDPLEFWCQIQYGESTNNNDRIRVNLFPGTILPKGEWIDVVAHYKINPNRADSFLKTWINGQLVVDYVGKIGIEGKSLDGDHKIGLYGGSQSQYREMNIDEIRYGNDYAEVDPSQLGGSASTTFVEAESANGQTGFSPFQIDMDNNASNGQYISAPGNENKNSPPNSGNVNYTFNLASSGDADLSARVLAGSTSSNSFWFKLDNNAWDFWSINNIASNWQVVSRSFTALSAGSHTLSIAYREGNTKLDWFKLTSSEPTVLEAETANLQSNFSPFQTGTDNNASNSEYIHAPGNDSRSNPPTNGQASYNFNMSSPGDQILTVRLLAISTSKNSFWYKIDSGAWSPWSISNISSNWQEVDRTIAGLSAGNHTLTIAYREGDTKLDWFKIAPQVSGTALRASVTQVSDIDEIYGSNDTNIKTPTIHPNPVNDILHVGLSLIENSGYSATLLDFSGQIVFSEQYSGRIGTNTISIDVSTLQKGTYILIIEPGQETIRRKIILQ